MDHHRSRHSMAFSTPQSQRFTLSQSRRSVSVLDPESSCAIETLFETLMNDPAKRDIVLKLMMQDKRKIEEIKRKQGNLKKGLEMSSPLKKVKQKFACESPTALLRRKALEVVEQPNENNPGTSSRAITPSPIPFELLLQNVTAYVEVKSSNCDRSAGAKALMQAMGAVVKDTFTRDVTHVIFKDGSFNTYQKAKLMKVHLVSVLWLEAIRRNHARVPEKNYPALGTDVFKVNLSLLCEEMQKDYEDVVRDELSRSLALNSQDQDNSSRTPTRTSSPSTDNRSSNNLSEDVIDVSQDCDAASIISKGSRCLQKTVATDAVPTTPDSLKLHSSPALTSDSDSSGGGIINGQAVKKVARNLLELTDDLDPGDNVQKISDVTSDKRSKESVENASSESTSLLIIVKKSETKKKRQRSLYNHVDGEDGLVLSPSGNKQRKRATVQLNTGDDVQELISCEGSVRNVEDMELTKCINNDFVTKRRTRMVSKNCDSFNDFNEEPTKNKDGLNLKEQRSTNESPAKSILTKKLSQVSAEISSKKETKKEKKPSRKTNSTQELSSLRLSTDSSRTRSITSSNDTRSITSSNEEICTTDTKVHDTKIATRKSSSTQKLSQLRLSVDSGTKSNLTNNEEATKPEKYSARRTRKSSSSQDLSSLKLSENTQENKIANELSTNKNGSQRKAQKRKSSSSHSRTSDESSTSSLIQSLDNALQILNENISPKKAVQESPSKISKQDAKCKQVIKNVSESKENKADHSESESDVGPRKITTRKSTRKIKTAPKIPPKNPRQTSDSDDSPSKEKKKVRRLYNMNYCFDEMSLPWNEKDREVKEKVPVVFKKSVSVTAAPILLTPRALAYVEKLKHVQLTSPNSVDKRTNKSTETPAGSQCPTRKSGRIAKRKEDANVAIEITPQKNRRSTLDFAPKVIKTPAKLKGTQSNKRLKKSSIVCTRFHRPDVQVFQQVVKKLGKFFVEDEVTERTTHLVAGESKRTINILRGIARGCWILKSEWLYKSLEAHEWLAEEDFELTEFSPAVQQCRLQQQAFGPLYSIDIFENCGPIYIAKSSVPRCSDLQELVKLCKGEVTQMQRNAVIVVGEFVRHDGVTCVVEKWILDSVMFNKKKAFKNYLITGK